MSLCRVFVLAEITRVISRQFWYSSCSTCCSKVFLHRSTPSSTPSSTLSSTHSHLSALRWFCPKCHTNLSLERVNHRYRVTFTITDGSTCCDVTVFGQNLQPYFGLSAASFQRLMSSTDQPSGVATEEMLKAAVEWRFVGNLFLFGFKTNPFRRTNSQKARHSPVKLSSVLMHYGKAVEVGERKSVVAWQMLPVGDCGDTMSVVMELNNMLKASPQSSCASSADASSLLGSSVRLSQFVGVDCQDAVEQSSRMDNGNMTRDTKCSQTCDNVSVFTWDGSTLNLEECDILPCSRGSDVEEIKTLPHSTSTDGGCRQEAEGDGERTRSVDCECSQTRHVNGTSATVQAETSRAEDRSIDDSSLLISSEDLRLFDQCHLSPPHVSLPSNDTVTQPCQVGSPTVTNNEPDVTSEKRVSTAVTQCVSDASKTVTDVSTVSAGGSYDEMPESEDLDAFLRMLPADASLNEHQLCGLAGTVGHTPRGDCNAVCATREAHTTVGGDFNCHDDALAESNATNDVSGCDNDELVECNQADKIKLNDTKLALFTDVFEDDTDSCNVISPSQQLPGADGGTPLNAAASGHLTLPESVVSCSFDCSSDLFDSRSSGDSPRLSRQLSCISSTQDSAAAPPGVTNRRVTLLKSGARNVHFARRLSSMQSVDAIDRQMTSTPLGDVIQVRRRSCLKAAALVRSWGHVTACDESYDGSQELFSPCIILLNPATGVSASVCSQRQLTSKTASPFVTADLSMQQLRTKQDNLDRSVTKMGTHLPAVHDTVDSPDLFSQSPSQPLTSLEVSSEAKCDTHSEGGHHNRSSVTRNILGDLINTDFDVNESDRRTSGQYDLCSQDLFSQSFEATDAWLCRKLF